MNRIEAKSERRRERLADARRGRLRLRPAVLALEGRALLSTLTVINTSDSGPGSLRAAISQADQDGGGDTIVFSSMFDTPQTITLTGGQLELTGTEAGATITGPGANLLTVSGNNASRVFLVDANASAKIAGLTVTGGNAQNDDGGGVEVNNDASLTLTDCTISNWQRGSGRPHRRRRRPGLPQRRLASDDGLHCQQQQRRCRRRPVQQRHGHPDRLHRQRQLLLRIMAAACTSTARRPR